MTATVDELVALDLLTLREHTERAGDRLEPAAHAQALQRSLAISELHGVRRGGRLVAYALLSRERGDDWFVRAFNVDPAHRNGGVMRELLAAVAGHVRARGAATLRSHVYKTNAPSIAFHRRLGFRVTNENEKAFEFTLDELAGAAAFTRR